MRIIEELLQRFAALLLTAVWFVIPLGFGLYSHNSAPELVVDDSRLALGEARSVVWMSELAMATAPDPGVDEGERSEGERSEQPQVEPAPVPLPAAPPAPTRNVAEAASALQVTPDTAPVAAPSSGSALGAQRVVSSSSVMRRPTAAVSTATSTGAKVRPSGKADCAEPDPMVSAQADGEFRVNRDLVERYASDWEALSSLGWVRVHENERGRRDGFELRGIRCGTLLAQVGLKNRDTVHSVNGKAVKNLFGALAAYRKFKRDDLVEVEITRNGETRYLTYHMH